MPETDYISNVYKALSDNLEGFDKDENTFRQELKNPEYAAKVHKALSDNLEGFKKTEEEFYGNLGLGAEKKSPYQNELQNTSSLENGQSSQPQSIPFKQNADKISGDIDTAQEAFQKTKSQKITPYENLKSSIDEDTKLKADKINFLKDAKGVIEKQLSEMERTKQELNNATDPNTQNILSEQYKKQQQAFDNTNKSVNQLQIELNDANKRISENALKIRKFGDVPKLEQSFGRDLYESFKRGSESLGSMIAKTPSFLYDVAAIPQNIIAEQTGLPIATSSQQLSEQLGLPENEVANFYDNAIKESQAKLQEKYDKGVTEYLSNGEYEKGFKLLANQVVESAPISISLALGNAAGLTPVQSILGGGAAFGAANKSELDEQNPNMPESQKTANALSKGLFEGMFEQFGITKLGSIARDIVEKSGKEAAQEIVKKGFVETYKPIAKKYLGNQAEEAVSEAATQFAQNAVDKFSGAKPEINLMDGVADAGLVGLGAGVAASTPVGALEIAKKYKSKQFAAKEAVKNAANPKHDTELKEELDAHVKSGVMNEEEAKHVVDNVDKAKLANAKIPEKITDEKQRANLTRLIAKKEDLQGIIKQTDDVLAEPYKAQLEQVNEKIKEASKIEKPKEEINNENETINKYETGTGILIENDTSKPDNASVGESEEQKKLNERYKDIGIDKIDEESLAKAYVDEAYAKQDINNIPDAIANTIGNITKSSFEMFGDKNNITQSMAKSYFRKEGKSIDQVAQEASELLNGMEVTPEDVVQYIMNNPNGVPKGRNERMKRINEAHTELTGKQINKTSAKKLLQRYTKENDISDEMAKSLGTDTDFFNSDGNLNFDKVLQKIETDPGYFTQFPNSLTKEELETYKNLLQDENFKLKHNQEAQRVNLSDQELFGEPPSGTEGEFDFEQEGKRKKGIIETINESDKTTEGLKEKVKDVDPFYDVLTNKEAIASANEQIGLDLSEAKAKVLANTPPSAEKSALTLMLIKHYEKVKDYDSAIEIINSYDSQLREAGRFIQAASLWNKMSPETVVRNAKKVSKEIGFELPTDIQSEIFKRMSEVDKLPEGKEKQKATIEVLNYIADQLPTSLSEKFDAYRYTNMLSNPKAHLKNISGNLFNMFITEPANIGINATYDLFKNIYNPAARDYKFSHVPKYYKTVLTNMPDAFMAAKETFANGYVADKILDINGAANRIEALRKTKLPKSLTAVMRFLEAQDRFFSVMIANGEKVRLMSNGSSESEANEKATKLANEYLYREKLDADDKTRLYSVRALDALGQAINKVRKTPIVGKPFSWFVPFVNTPINVAKLGIKFSPLALADIGIGTALGKEHTRQHVAGDTIGSMVLGIGATLALQGLTTWTLPRDKEERENFYASGRKPFSVKIGDKWVPMAYFGPFAVALGLPTALKHYYQDTKESVTDSDLAKISKALGSTSLMIMNNTPLQSVEGFTKILSGEDEAKVSKQLGYSTGQVIPLNGLVRYINTILDPVYRKSRDYKEAVKSGIPELSKDLEPYLNPEGEPSKREPMNYVMPYDLGISNKEYEILLQERRAEIKDSATE